MGRYNSGSPRIYGCCWAKRIAATVFFMFSLIGCVGLQVKTETAETEFNKSAHSGGQIEHFTGQFSEYLISPGDVLDVMFQFQTWEKTNEFLLGVDQVISVTFERNSELNVTQRIRPDGKISLPYLKTIHADGKTVESLTEELIAAYRPILRHPGLYITVSEYQSSIQELKDTLETSSRGASRQTTVRPGGYASFPLIDDILVAGKTVPEVNKILNDKYREISNGLQCNLFLEENEDYRIYILGEAKAPGPYAIQKPITILEALALAGGYTHEAKLENVVVIRKYKDVMAATRINISGSLKLKDDAWLTYLQPDDIIYIPRTVISKAAEVADYLSTLTFFRGFSISKEWRSDDYLKSSGSP